jgi:hypothetical protein
VIRCPEGKRRTVLADIHSQSAAALQLGTVDRKRAQRLVGRLCHLAQIAPAIRGHLHGGHTIAEASWPGSGGRRGVGSMHLATGSPAHTAWLELLRVAHREISANTGVSIGPRSIALPRSTPGTLTSFTDASGEDGFGGYGFLTGRPKEVFLLAQPWPPIALAALQAASSEIEAALRRDGIQSAALHLSMPAAELFAQLALPRAVARLVHCSSVYAVGDCEPSG